MIGLGSIGKRHLKNIQIVLSNRGCVFSIDALRSSYSELPKDISSLLDRQYFSFDDLPKDYDVIFISNPTSEHYITLKQAIQHAKHVFLEKPAFERANYSLADLKLKDDSVYYVACPLRYNSVISYFKDFIGERNVFAARSICSSYLPDWRLNTDYRQCYSAKTELGGGVRIDLIHEWDYLLHLFGLPKKVKGFAGRVSNLEISSQDIAAYIAEYDDKILSLHLDYFGRVSRRGLELYLEDDVVIGDLNNNNIRFLQSGEIINLPQERNAMQLLEIEYFFDILAGKNENFNDLFTAVKTLEIALGSEE